MKSCLAGLHLRSVGQIARSNELLHDFNTCEEINMYQYVFKIYSDSVASHRLEESGDVCLKGRRDAFKIKGHYVAPEWCQD